ncbi:MAG TPA: CAAX protease [Prolixibacteraceae bacterium]|jgi:hypothetical protein|nr:CAAX protease [Prolixibacteraceae bacterium]
MKFSEFEAIMSMQRINRYVQACEGQTKKAMTLYRLNLRLSQEMFTIISCFEVALRNAIDQHILVLHGNDWLKNSTHKDGIFYNKNCKLTAGSINDAISKLNQNYTHNKLVAELGFGFWRYMFAPHQFSAVGKTLLQLFPAKPTSTPSIQYNHTYVFNQLAQINNLRNRIAHHEPICFQSGIPVKNTTKVRQLHALILQLFQWMTIDAAALIYGLDHINDICNQIDSL